jgi:hypothetical protein
MELRILYILFGRIRTIGCFYFLIDIVDIPVYSSDDRCKLMIYIDHIHSFDIN